MEYIKVIKGELKKGISIVKDNIMKTELERKLKQATANEHCHANVSLLNDISRRTSNRETFFLERAFCTDRYSKSQNNDDKAYKMCSIVGIPKKSYYRLLYEIYEDGRYVKLDVPDDWYFKKYVMARLF